MHQYPTWRRQHPGEGAYPRFACCLGMLRECPERGSPMFGAGSAPLKTRPCQPAPLTGSCTERHPRLRQTGTGGHYRKAPEAAMRSAGNQRIS
ncbi:hypothetical protein CsSME_00032089 [Camellia sinensis var. sinensis]